MPRLFRKGLLPVGIFLLLTFATLFVVSPPPAAARASSFPDVSQSIPAYDAIEFMTGAKVISGYKDGTFGPGKTLTRGQAAKILVLWWGLTLTKSGSVSFSDLDDVYRTYVLTAANQGWITGFSDGLFRPYSILSRQQMAMIMVRAMGWEAEAKKLSSSRIQEILTAFSDRGEIASVARPYVALAVQRGLFSGSGGCFLPKDGITRAQFSLVVFRAELSLRAVIEEVRSASSYTDKTRVVFDLSRAASKITASASAGGTLTIDYTGGAIGGTLSQTIGSSEVKSVTACQQAYNPRTVRITVNLARYQYFQVISMAPSGDKGYRIVVDVYSRTDGPSGDGPPLICVDPGHGGSDSGAIGVSGAKEKDVNLKIGLLLAEDLRKAGLQVKMTRDNDSTVQLQERANIANTAKASLFVSVHTNSVSSSETSGTETFYEGTGSDNYDPESKLLAQAIQRNLVAALGSKDRGAKTWYGGNLAVLKGSTMTGVLTEVGFLTNAAEEAKLLSSNYQQTAAQAITDGILEYLGWSIEVHTS